MSDLKAADEYLTPRQKKELVDQIIAVLSSAECDKHGYMDRQRFLGFTNPDEPFLLHADVAEVAANAAALVFEMWRRREKQANR